MCALAALPAAALDKPAPSHLKFVEYIESNSDKLAYIDTGYVPNANTEIEMDFAFIQADLSEKTYVFGVYGQSGMRFQFSYGPEDCMFGFGPWSNFDNAVTGFAYNTNRHVVKYVHNDGFYFDGTKVVPKEGVDLVTWEGGTWDWNDPTGKNLYLGACNANGSVNANIGPIRIYSCKIWDNGELVRNFLPAQTDLGAAVLYDAVRRKIHSNANVDWNGEKGKFIASINEVTVPTAYRKASYIEANRTAYINTGYVPNGNTELEMAFAFTSLTNIKTYVFGSYGNDGGRFMMSYGPESTGCFIGYGNTYTNSFVLPYNTNRHVVKYVPGTGKGFYFDSELVDPPKTDLTTWKGTGTNLFLGQVNPNGGEVNPTNLSPIRIYSCKIWETNKTENTLTLKRDLVPKQRVFDGKNGLYDNVTGNFYAYYGNRADFTAFIPPPGMIVILR